MYPIITPGYYIYHGIHMEPKLHEERRVQEIRGSYILYLPKDWCRDLGIGRGSRLLIRRSGSKLIVEPSETERFRVYADIDIENMDERSLFHILVSLYIAGAEQIKLTSRKPLSSDVRRMIISYLRYIPGFGVFDEARNYMVLREVRRSTDLGIIARRIANNSRILFEKVISLYSGSEPQDEDLEELDNEIDAIRREAERLFNTMLINLSVGEEAGGLQRAYILVQIVRLLERISDHLVALASIASSTLPNDREKIYGVLSSIYEYYRDIDRLIEFDHVSRGGEKLKNLAEDAREIIARLVLLIDRKGIIHSTISSARIGSDIASYHIMRIYDYITDIAEYMLNKIAISALTTIRS